MAFLFYLVSYFVDKTLVTSCARYDDADFGRLMKRFYWWLICGLPLVLPTWTFFFFTHGPNIIGWVSAIVYTVLATLMVGGIALGFSKNWVNVDLKFATGQKEYGSVREESEEDANAYVFPGLQPIDTEDSDNQEELK
jgi:hypothetical protein